MISALRRAVGLIALLLLALWLVGCAADRLPDGTYEVRPGSVTYDGQTYSLHWVDAQGQVHRLERRDLKMVQDGRTFLEVRDGEPILHLKPDEPITVLGRDKQGEFGSLWFPFLLGHLAGSLGRDPVVITQPAPEAPQPPPDRPAYRYPPTDRAGREEVLTGSIGSDRPTRPDYERWRPSATVVGGQAAGTGGGTAVSGRTPYASGQTGGTGSGSAVLRKSGVPSSGDRLSPAPSLKSRPSVQAPRLKPSLPSVRSLRR